MRKYHAVVDQGDHPSREEKSASKIKQQKLKQLVARYMQYQWNVFKSSPLDLSQIEDEPGN